MKLTLETVDLEYCTLCHCDYVEAREGATADGKLIGRFCKVNNTVVYSEGTQMWFKFKTDSGNGRRGFYAIVSRLKLRKRKHISSAWIDYVTCRLLLSLRICFISSFLASTIIFYIAPFNQPNPRDIALLKK